MSADSLDLRVPSTGSDYAALSRLVRAAGLMDRRPLGATLKILAVAALYVAGWLVLVLGGAGWWQLGTAVLLAPGRGSTLRESA